MANIQNLVNAIGLKKLIKYHGWATSIYNITWPIPSWNPTASVNYKIEVYVAGANTFAIAFGSYFNNSSVVVLTVEYTK